MIKIVLNIIFLFPLIVIAQGQKWEMIIGNQYWDDYPHAIIQRYDKGIWVSASSEKFEGTAWQIKTNVNGDIIYDKRLVHEHCQLSTDVVVTGPNGSIYFGGTFFPDEGGFLPYVIKVDSCGELLWCRNFPLASNSVGGFVGDMLLNQKNELVILMSYSTGNLDDQIYLSCLDGDGNQLWFNSYARKHEYPLLVDPLGYDLLEHNNEYYIAGDCYYPYPGNPNHVYLRPLFIGIDSLYKEKFMTPFYALDSIYGDARELLPLNDSTILGVGNRLLNGVNTNSLIMIMKANGEEMGYQQISNSTIDSSAQYNAIREAYRINDSLFISPIYMGINWEERFGEIVYDLDGNVYHKSNRGHYKNNFFSTKTKQNEFCIAVPIQQNSTDIDILLYKIDKNLDPVPFDTTTYVYDSLCPGGVQPGPIDLSDCLVWTGIEDTPTPAQYYESIRWIPVQAYPNPVTAGKFTLEFENTGHHQNMELRCYDDFGRQIHSQKIYKGQQDTDVDVSDWLPGIYIAVVYSDGSARGKAKFVVE